MGEEFVHIAQHGTPPGAVKIQARDSPNDMLVPFRMTQDDKPNPPAKPAADRSGSDSALAVWLKLGGLLIGLSAFCALIFFLSRMIRPH